MKHVGLGWNDLSLAMSLTLSTFQQRFVKKTAEWDSSSRGKLSCTPYALSIKTSKNRLWLIYCTYGLPYSYDAIFKSLWAVPLEPIRRSHFSSQLSDWIISIEWPFFCKNQVVIKSCPVYMPPFSNRVPYICQWVRYLYIVWIKLWSKNRMIERLWSMNECRPMVCHGDYSFYEVRAIKHTHVLCEGLNDLMLGSYRRICL